MSTLVSQTRLLWGMPITVAVVAGPAFEAAPPPPGAAAKVTVPVAAPAAAELIESVYAYFEHVDGVFSTFRPDSEVSRLNAGALPLDQASPEMRSVLGLGQEMRWATGGYFDMNRDGKIDPLGLVKGWALSNAAALLRAAGCENFYVEAGGDFQAAGRNAEGKPWRVGIRNPFNTRQIVKVLAISDRGVATSGTYIRGQHIYNPVGGGLPDPALLSITVIGPDVYEADCYATAAFAMGRKGIEFIAAQEGFEGYMIDIDKRATFTAGFGQYVAMGNRI